MKPPPKKVLRFKTWYEFYFIISKHHLSLVSTHNEFLNLHSKLQNITVTVKVLAKKSSEQLSKHVKSCNMVYTNPQAVRQTFHVDK